MAWQQPCWPRVDETVQEVAQEKTKERKDQRIVPKLSTTGQTPGDKNRQSIPHLIPGVQHTLNAAGLAPFGHSAKQPSSGCP
jgi:hypothetical protein